MAGKKAIAKPNQAVTRRGGNSHDIPSRGQTVVIGTLFEGLRAKGYKISPQVLEALSLQHEPCTAGDVTLAARRLSSVMPTPTSRSMQEISVAVRAYKLMKCHIPTVLVALLDHADTFIKILGNEDIITFFSEPVVWADFHCVLCLVKDDGVPTVMFTLGHPNVRLFKGTMLVFSQTA